MTLAGVRPGLGGDAGASKTAFRGVGFREGREPCGSVQVGGEGREGVEGRSNFGGGGSR